MSGLKKGEVNLGVRKTHLDSINTYKRYTNC